MTSDTDIAPLCTEIAEAAVQLMKKNYIIVRNFKITQPKIIQRIRQYEEELSASAAAKKALTAVCDEAQSQEHSVSVTMTQEPGGNVFTLTSTSSETLAAFLAALNVTQN